MKHSSEFNPPLSNVSAPFIGSNPRRAGLWLSPPSAGRYTVSSQNPAVLDGPGITIPAGTQPVYIGGWGMEWVQRSLLAVHSAGGISVSVIEVEDMD